MNDETNGNSVAATRADMPQITTYADLAGKVVVVTGGSRGIGAAVCHALARIGARVVVNGNDEQAIESVVAEIRSYGGSAVGMAADCTNEAAFERMCAMTEREFGAVDVLVAYAGGYGDPKPTVEITEEWWRHALDVNLTGKFLTVKTFLPGMIARQRGAIVLMSSSAGRLPSQASAAYAAAEAGVCMLAKHLDNEVGRHGVRVNCVAPSAIRNERMQKNMTPEQQEQLAKIFPLGRIGEPRDVAQATLFIASDASSWISGITLDISGGRIIF
jgi:3-oxoacyl-[acyl-carrier protein] reductase